VCKPARAQNAAQLDPAGPPPIIATSKISIAGNFTECNEDNEGFSSSADTLFFLYSLLFIISPQSGFDRTGARFNTGANSR
jgi:hypothetical protein